MATTTPTLTPEQQTWIEAQSKLQTHKVLMLSCTVYDRSITEVRWVFEGEDYLAYANADFNYLRDIMSVSTGNRLPKIESVSEQSFHSDDVDKSVHSPGKQERGHSCPRQQSTWHTRWPIILSLSGIAALSLGVVPPEELEATKPQLRSTQAGNNLIIEWDSHPDVYYFMEGSPDLQAGSWVSIVYVVRQPPKGHSASSPLRGCAIFALSRSVKTSPSFHSG